MKTFWRPDAIRISRYFAAIFFLTGFMLFTGQAFAQTIEFPDNGSAIYIGDADVPGNQITIETLVYMENNSLSGDIISKHLTPANVNYLLRPSGFELTTYINGNSGLTHYIRAVNPVQLILKKWYHLAATYDGARVKYYVNGCLVTDTAFTGNLFQNDYVASIGVRSNCNCEQLLGRVDEMRIWKTVRTQKEIAENMMTLANPRSETGLLAYYKFDGNYNNSAGNNLWNGKKVGDPAFYPQDASVQSFEVTGIQTINAECDKMNDGNITVMTNRLDAAYSIDGIHFQAANQFSFLKTGNYTVVARASDGCTIKNDVMVGNNHSFVPLAITGSLCRQISYLGHDSAGTYTDTVAAINGCDTLRTLYLSDNLRSFLHLDSTICDGQICMGHKNTGRYNDTLVAASGCDSIIELQLTVSTEPHPDLGADRSLCRGDSIHLFPGNYSSYLWQDGSPDNHFTVTQAGIYAVNVSNACGTAHQQVTISDGHCGLYFPNAFTPNGDGRNDEFRPVIFNVENFQWRIYNRFGQMIFEAKADKEGWDGRINGQLQSPGVYVWACSYTINNKTEIKKGSFILIR